MSALTAYNALNKKIACYARVPGSPAIKATFGVRECTRVSRRRAATREYFATFEILKLILCERLAVSTLDLIPDLYLDVSAS